MTITKTSELTGAALDWATCLALGRTDMQIDPDDGEMMASDDFDYSTDWAQGGPIIEREEITVSKGSPVRGLEWMACDAGCTHVQHGPSYLIAAMRCYVASRLGDAVDIPQELTK